MNSIFKDLVIGMLLGIIMLMALTIFKQKVALMTKSYSIEAYRNELEATWRTTKGRVNSAYTCRPK